MPLVKWALLGGSDTGSSWVNHVLSSHPCIVSADEYLMNRKSALARFQESEAGVAEVLGEIEAHGRALLHKQNASSCAHAAVGVKLKALARDVIFTGARPNSAWVTRQLERGGWRVLLLQRRNHLDVFLSGRSRARTGSLHCKVQSGCDPFALNTSMTVLCSGALSSILARSNQTRAFEAAFRAWGGDHDGRLLRLEYERMLTSAGTWPRAMALLGFPEDDACLLQQEHIKRVQQTQRELVANYDKLEACLSKAGRTYASLLHADERPSSGPLPHRVPDAAACAAARGPAGAAAAGGGGGGVLVAGSSTCCVSGS